MNKRTQKHLILAALAVALTVCAPHPPGPPRERGEFREPDLVEIAALDPSIRLDIRYATANNLVGRPVYPEARAFLQRPAAEALVRAHRGLAADGYRP